jgi:hypothetical protein
MDTPDRRFAISVRINDLLQRTSPPPAWADSWRALAHSSSDEEQLAVLQAIRDSGVLPYEPGAYLVFGQLRAMAQQADPQAVLGDDYGDFVCDCDGEEFDDEEFDDLHAGADWDEDDDDLAQELREEVLLRLMRQHDEHDLATAFAFDHPAFLDMMSRGERFFARPMPSAPGRRLPWVRSLLAAVADAIAADGLLAPLELRWDRCPAYHFMQVFPRPVQLIGGPRDGELIRTGFKLHLDELLTAFEPVHRVMTPVRHRIDAAASGPHVIVKGDYQERPVLLGVWTAPPNFVAGDPELLVSVPWALGDFLRPARGVARLETSEPS